MTVDKATRWQSIGKVTGESKPRCVGLLLKDGRLLGFNEMDKSYLGEKSLEDDWVGIHSAMSRQDLLMIV